MTYPIGRARLDDGYIEEPLPAPERAHEHEHGMFTQEELEVGRVVDHTEHTAQLVQAHVSNIVELEYLVYHALRNYLSNADVERDYSCTKLSILLASGQIGVLTLTAMSPEEHAKRKERGY